MESEIKKILFSIVIPTYNDLNLFMISLNSVLTQDYSNFELIIVDDSSTSDIQNYIQLFEAENRIIYIKNSIPIGAVKNWNYGLQNVKGDYCILLHHDESFESTLIVTDMILLL
jgi:glycosyltransferase involved in cell wall biosynthesis